MDTQVPPPTASAAPSKLIPKYAAVLEEEGGMEEMGAG